MKCRKCNKKNAYQAHYCFYCGNAFTKEEKEQASKEGLVGGLKKLKMYYDTLHLSFITSKLWFKVLTIVAILFVAFLGIYLNGTHLKIVKSDAYNYQYNEKLKEYYLYTKESSSKINLYAVGLKDNLTVEYYNENGNLIVSENLKIEDITLKSNTYNNNYYILKNGKDSIKIYVYKEN